jgi:DNA polymerase-4/protein ImuB
MRILCVLVPHFPWQCEVERQPALEGCPVIVTYAVGSQRLVLDGSADLTDIQSGMPLQQAIALHGEVKLIPADMSYYSSVFERLLDTLEERSPLVEGADPGCAYLGLEGLQMIYTSDGALINAIKEVVPGAFDVRLGIAEGKFPAYLAALYSPPGGFRVLAGDMGSILKDLPGNVLPISAKSKQKLHDFGLHTLGQVSALPMGPLQSQFGPEGKRIWQLARGHDDSPLYPRRMEEAIEESTTLPSVTVSLEAILVSIESLLSRVFAKDALKGKGISGLVLWATIWGSGYWERSIKFKEPAMNPRSALSRIKQVLESHPPPGPVEELGLKLTALGYRSGRQRNLFSEVRAKDHLLDDIKQMELRLGGPQVYKIKEAEPWSRIPERRQVLVPISR